MTTLSASLERLMGPGSLGNPDDPTLRALPKAVADLNTPGVGVAVSLLQATPANIQATIQQLQDNPKAFIAHTFRMTNAQLASLWQMNDVQLGAITSPVISRLQQNDFTHWTLQFSQVRVLDDEPSSVGIAGNSIIEQQPHWHFECTCSLRYSV